MTFTGFKSLSANFTPTPNQFFDRIIGYYPSCVVTVVAILIRSTLGWEDPMTGDRRVEAELPLSSFVRPGLCESSARKGLAMAIAAGFIVQTAQASNREGARYALRWEDVEAQQEAIERSRRAIQDPILNVPHRCEASGGLKNTPHHIIKKTKTPNPEKKVNKNQTLNVSNSINFVATKEGKTSTNSLMLDQQNVFDQVHSA